MSNVQIGVDDEKLLQRVREKYSLPADFVLTVAPIDGSHNLKNIVKAIFYTDRIHWVLVGKPTLYLFYIKHIVRRLGLHDRVHIITRVDCDCLPAIYRLSRAVVIPSGGDDALSSVAQALECNSPMIVAELPAHKALLGDAAYYSPMKSIDGWADAIRWVTTSEVLRRDMLGFYEQVKM